MLAVKGKDAVGEENMVGLEEVMVLEAGGEVIARKEKQGSLSSGKKAAVGVAGEAAKFGVAAIKVLVLDKERVEEMGLEMGDKAENEDKAFGGLEAELLDELGIRSFRTGESWRRDK